MNLYSLMDLAADEYGPPFIAKTNEVALRQFKQLIGTVPADSRTDYRLVLIGTFDVATGDVEACKKEVINFASEVING